jgi:hypothetical protein
LTRCLGARQPLAIFEALQILWRQCFLVRSHAVRHGANVGYWHEAEVSTPVPDVHYEAQSGLQAGLNFLNAARLDGVFVTLL